MRIDDCLTWVSRGLILGVWLFVVYLAVGCAGVQVSDDERDYWRALDRARFEATLRCSPPPRKCWK